jgi:hypothetical protein
VLSRTNIEEIVKFAHKEELFIFADEVRKKWTTFHIHASWYYQIFFYSLTDAQVNCFKNSFKMYIKIYVHTAPTCFGAVTPSSGSALLMLANVTVVKIANYTKYISVQPQHHTLMYSV